MSGPPPLSFAIRSLFVHLLFTRQLADEDRGWRPELGVGGVAVAGRPCAAAQCHKVVGGQPCVVLSGWSIRFRVHHRTARFRPCVANDGGVHLTASTPGRRRVENARDVVGRRRAETRLAPLTVRGTGCEIVATHRGCGCLHINVKKRLQFLRDSRKMPDSLRGTDFWFHPVAKHQGSNASLIGEGASVSVVAVAQLVRVPDCDSGGRGFESPQPPHCFNRFGAAETVLQ